MPETRSGRDQKLEHTHFCASMVLSLFKKILQLLLRVQSNLRTPRMTFVNFNRIIFKMATNGVHSHTSDFSIDHILNRAGDQFLEKRNEFKTISVKSSVSSEDESCDSYGKVHYRNDFNEREKFIQIPTFDWLNYTRYNMPRISSKSCSKQIVNSDL